MFSVRVDKWIRIGVCNRCGVCCRSLPLFSKLTDMERALLRVYCPDAEEIMTSPDGKCKFLIENPDGTTTCSNYINRPRFCRAYPKVPDDLVEGCSFKLIPKC